MNLFFLEYFDLFFDMPCGKVYLNNQFHQADLRVASGPLVLFGCKRGFSAMLIFIACIRG